MNIKQLIKESIVGMDKIVHLDEMSTDDFIKFVKGFINILDRNVEVSEKIDGQNFSFGLDIDNNFFTKTKKSRPVHDPSMYGEFSFLDGIKQYHNVLNGNKKGLLEIKSMVARLLKQDTFNFQVFCEILPSSQTNIVKYDADKIGKGAIVLFDIKIDGISILQQPWFKTVFDKLVKTFDKYGGWRVYNKPLVSQNEFQFNVNHLITLENLYRNYFDILKSRKRADSATKQKAKRVIQSLMDNIKGQFIRNMLLNRKSVLGNITPEGFILRDFSNNLLVKLVDKDSFSKENTEGSKFVKLASTHVKNTNMKIKNDIFGNADIMKNFAKVIEKAVDWAFVQKQTNPSFKVTSLDDILRVAYDDMAEEKRIKYSANQSIDKTVDYLKQLRLNLIDSLQGLNLDRDNLPESKFIISKEKIEAYISSVENTITQLNGLKGKSGIKVYLTIIAFVFGPSKIQELKQEFSLNESKTNSTLKRLLS